MATSAPQTPLGNFFRWLSEIFFYGAPGDKMSLYWLFYYIGNSCGQIPIVGSLLRSRFYSVMDLCGEIHTWFDYAADDIDEWWAEIVNIWDNLSRVVNYAWGWLTDRANQAYDWAVSAYTWAWNAIQLASQALTEIPAAILEKLEAAYNLASTALQVLPAWIQTTFDNVNSSLTSLWDYASTTVWNKAVDAWNKAANAWDYASTTVWPAVQDLGTDLSSLWDYARTTVWNKAIEAWNKAAAAFTYAADLVNSLDAVLRSWALGKIDDAKAAVLAEIAAPINLITTWFDDIQNFFNAPLDWLESKFTDWFLGPE